MYAVTDKRGEAHVCLIENVTKRKPRDGWHPPQPFFILPTDLQNIAPQQKQERRTRSLNAVVYMDGFPDIFCIVGIERMNCGWSECCDTCSSQRIVGVQIVQQSHEDNSRHTVAEKKYTYPCFTAAFCKVKEY